jgi:replicative DNA helicase
VPGLGKTSFALTLLKEMTINQNISSLLFSMEMSKSALEKRMRNIDFVMNDNLHIVDTAELTIEELSSILESKKQESKVEYCFIDYFGLIKNKNQDISDTLNTLKSLALKLNIAIIALMQMNRKYNGIRPELSHYETFSNNADVIFALYKNVDHPDTEVLILKD